MKKILLCDDEVIIRNFLESLLEDEIDAEFIHAEDGRQGIALIGDGKDFDLIICDMHMPNKNGDEVYAHNQKSGQTPFIMLSGDGTYATDDIAGFNEASNTGVMPKPWEEDELLTLVTKLLAQ